MKTTWKKTSIGLLLDNEDRYEGGVKLFHLANVIENPDSEKLMTFGEVYAKLSGDQLDGVEVTTVTNLATDI
ncbi:hypothetical protein RD055328_12200 [Companilactobacillus sp. RD055328]|uniref:DUF1659 domain-containing protein n=1 Tax=Companilactobacillus sp. RD055328 TaxID=2916634 RepID=UPI001FC81251|nr:hypothetical protein [Companilactobacillus sp. RD055328]GKQ43297.1 hypothetical protein RD055328_12200 [Companilactobacillus sp. RD055328]